MTETRPREDCGTIKYLGKDYKVTWDKQTCKVYISKIDNPSLSYINYPGFVASNKEEAPGVALKMLKDVLGD